MKAPCICGFNPLTAKGKDEWDMTPKFREVDACGLRFETPCGGAPYGDSVYLEFCPKCGTVRVIGVAEATEASND